MGSKHICYSLALIVVGTMTNCTACSYLEIKASVNRQKMKYEFLSSPNGKEYLDRRERLANKLLEQKTTDTLILRNPEALDNALDSILD